MLTKEDLRKFTSLTGFNLWQTEKDYLQHLFLIFLSRESKDELVFKGGTALQKAYGLNRFSIDLDFTLRKEIKESLIEKICRDITLFGFECKSEKIKENLAISFKLAVKGPLYDGSERSISTLRIEISKREKVLLEPEAREIVPVYTDLHPYTVLIMHPKEILAEKIRAILTRTKAKDLYDLWFLLKKGVSIDLALVNEKLKLYEKSFEKSEFISCIRAVKEVWKTELEPLVTFLPSFDTVLEEVLEKLSTI